MGGADGLGETGSSGLLDVWRDKSTVSANDTAIARLSPALARLAICADMFT
jgi:hypothetical protein